MLVEGGGGGCLPLFIERDMKKLDGIVPQKQQRWQTEVVFVGSDAEYLKRVALAARNLVNRWQDSGDGTYQNMKFEEAMEALAALVEEEA